MKCEKWSAWMIEHGRNVLCVVIRSVRNLDSSSNVATVRHAKLMIVFNLKEQQHRWNTKNWGHVPPPNEFEHIRIFLISSRANTRLFLISLSVTLPYISHLTACHTPVNFSFDCVTHIRIFLISSRANTRLFFISFSDTHPFSPISLSVTFPYISHFIECHTSRIFLHLTCVSHTRKFFIRLRDTHSYSYFFHFISLHTPYISHFIAWHPLRIFLMSLRDTPLRIYFSFHWVSRSRIFLISLQWHTPVNFSLRDCVTHPSVYFSFHCVTHTRIFIMSLRDTPSVYFSFHCVTPSPYISHFIAWHNPPYISHVIAWHPSVYFSFQWDLVCSKGYMKDLSQTILVVGVMVGAMGFTALSDYFGRKPIFLFSQWAMVIVGVTTAFCPNLYFFFVLRFITGALQQVSSLLILYKLDDLLWRV